MAPSSPNTSNHQRIARALNTSTGCGYQTALQRVQAAADAGRLPARLDQAGREEAVRMLTENHLRPTPAVAAESVPSKATPPSTMLLGLGRGGLDKTVAVTDFGALARGRQVLPVDLGDLSPTELLLTVHEAMEKRRALQQKERVVTAMRAERDRKLNPFLLPAVPEGLREQVERLASQTRKKPRSGEPQ
ncbi:hypothetical protein [Streptomyces sp. NRRL S-350]|uniref:hypothetical protein n=1 Tax=Streptomyces sp. NRRL S-350 TaxID=1463902 RepID=UPI0004C257AC|nr:hypothetical protein [Streptomyces sp. NRRL S-350]